MRILIVHNYYQDSGGEDVVFHNETKALCQRHEVCTLTFQNKRGGAGLPQFLLYPWNFSAKSKLVETLKSFRPDVVHVHNTHYASGPILLREVKQRGLPLVMTLHNYRLLCPSATLFYDGRIYTDSIRKNFPWKGIRKGVLDHSVFKTFWTALTYYLHRRLNTWKNVDKFLPLTSFSKNLILGSSVGLKEEQIEAKPNFFSLNDISERKRGEHYLFVGRLSAEKGILQLIEAFLLSDKKLRVIGSGPLREAIVDKLKDKANITLEGAKSQEEVNVEMKTCKAVLVPSVCYEGGVPLTIIEAMACKTPVIASNLGPIPDQIIENETGWLFDPHHPDSILQAINRFENSTDLTKVVENANQIYQNTYTQEKVLSKLEEVYREVIDKNRILSLG